MTNSRCFLSSLSAAGMLLGFAGTAGAQNAPPAAKRAPLINGFEVRVDPVVTNEEMNRQPDLWMMEVTFKSMRMRWVDMTDPQTGQKKRELVWYLVYKAVRRPIDRRKDTANTRPQNVEDDPGRFLIVPEFTLVGTDGGARKIYPDVLFPRAQAAINKREARYSNQPKLKNTVKVAGSIAPPTPEGAAKENAIYGVAMWRDLDPEIDYFTVYMAGFSNGYRKQGGLTYRKVIVQKFERPGDRFFQTEAEIKRDGDAMWIDWPEDTPVKKTSKPPVLKKIKPPAPKKA